MKVIAEYDENADQRHYKIQNAKLRSEVGKLRKYLAQFTDLKNLSNLSHSLALHSKSKTSFKHKNAKSSNSINRTRHDQSKLSSTKVYNSASVTSFASKDISSIRSVCSSFDSYDTLLTSDQTESLGSTGISTESFYGHSQSHAESSHGSMYQTASASFSLTGPSVNSLSDSGPSSCESSHNKSNSTAASSSSSSYLSSHNTVVESEVSHAENYAEITDDITINGDHDVLRNISYSVASIHQSQMIPQSMVFDYNMDISRYMGRINDFVPSISRKSQLELPQSHTKKRTVPNAVATSLLESMSPLAKSCKAADPCDQRNQRSMTIVDSINATAASDEQISIRDQSSEVRELVSESYYANYQNIYHTLYMEGSVKFHAKRRDRAFSISEYLPNDCSCCLCKLRNENGDSHDFCIRKHPLDESCQRGEPRRKNNQLKYCAQTVCNACMSSMTLLSRKSKTKKHKCIFDSCTIQSKSLAALQNHFAKHLKTKLFVCTICEKDYCSKSGLKSHERKHLNSMYIKTF